MKLLLTFVKLDYLFSGVTSG